jgi:hypothetical protein
LWSWRKKAGRARPPYVGDIDDEEPTPYGDISIIAGDANIADEAQLIQ